MNNEQRLGGRSRPWQFDAWSPWSGVELLQITLGSRPHHQRRSLRLNLTPSDSASFTYQPSNDLRFMESTKLSTSHGDEQKHIDEAADFNPRPTGSAGSSLCPFFPTCPDFSQWAMFAHYDPRHACVNGCRKRRALSRGSMNSSALMLLPLMIRFMAL